MSPSSNSPPVMPAPSTIAARRSSRLQAMKLPSEPQVSNHLAHVHTTHVTNNQPQNDHTTSISGDSDAAARFVAVDCLLRLRYTDADHLKFGSLPPPPASVGLFPTSGVTTQQPVKARSEKENEGAPLPKSITDATHVGASATTGLPSGTQPPKPKQTMVATTKRTRDTVLKRKADDDASGVNGPGIHTQMAEIRSFKRPRNKFIAEASDRVMRSSNAKVAVEVEGNGVNKVTSQQHESGGGSTKKATASTSAGNSIVDANTKPLAGTSDSIAGSKALDNKPELHNGSLDNPAPTSASAQRPPLTLIIPARARSAAVESVVTAVGSTSTVDSVIAVTEPEVELKAQKLAEKEPSAAPKIRVPGGKCINAAA